MGGGRIVFPPPIEAYLLISPHPRSCAYNLMLVIVCKKEYFRRAGRGFDVAPLEIIGLESGGYPLRIMVSIWSMRVKCLSLVRRVPPTFIQQAPIQTSLMGILAPFFSREK